MIEERTETAKTFLMPDGSRRTEIFTTPVHFKNSDDDWQPIDNTLVASEREGYLAENRANDYRLLIPEDAGSRPVRFQANGNWVSFKAHNASGTPEISGSQASIDALGTNVALEYEATSVGVKEMIVLSKPPAVSPNWTFALDASAGLTPRLAADGGIHITDGRQNVMFRIPAPFMFDSSDTEGGHSDNVSFTLSESIDSWELTVKADPTWLQESSRVYPVMIDPTVTTDPPLKDCWISAESPNVSNGGPDSPFLRVGVNDGLPRRSLLKFDVSSVRKDVTIQDAELQLYMDATQSATLNGAEYVARRMTHAWTGEATWNAHNGVNLWDTPGGDFAARDFVGTGINGSTSGYKSLDVTPMVTDWVEGLETNVGMIVKQKAEDTRNVLFFHSSNSAMQERWPKLVVTHDEPPPNTGFAPGETEVRAASIVSCFFNAQEPQRFPSQNRLEGVGIISGCFPRDPAVCRIETEIQIFNTIDRRWDLYWSGPAVFPNPCQGGRSVAATNNCEPRQEGHNYRTVTIVAIVEDADRDVDSDISPVRQYRCL